jgi:hypothetical protein
MIHCVYNFFPDWFPAISTICEIDLNIPELNNYLIFPQNDEKKFKGIIMEIQGNSQINKITVGALIMISIIAVEGIAIGIMNQTIYHLNDQISDLLNDNSDTTTSQTSTTTTTTTNTNSEYQELLMDYEALQKEYEIEHALHIDNSLASYYDSLRDSLGPTGTWSAMGESGWQSAANFAARLALHDQSKIYWTYLEATYHTSTGEYSYESAYDKMLEIYNLMGIRNSDSQLNKMAKILAFINEYITYRPEVNDRFHAPVETLAYKSGDCDDFTTLAAAYFDLIGVDCAIGCFKNSTLGGHAMLLIRLNNLGTYPYRYYPDLTSLGLPAGKWLIIEPQALINQQGTAWQSYWSLVCAGYVDVDTQLG